MPSSLPKKYLYHHSKNSKSFREAVKGIFKFTDINLAREAKNRLIHDYIDQPKYSKLAHHWMMDSKTPFNIPYKEIPTID